MYIWIDKTIGVLTILKHFNNDYNRRNYLNFSITFNISILKEGDNVKQII